MKIKTSRQINAERKKAGKSPLNFALFRKVIQKLESAPEAYLQRTTVIIDESAPCGTAACLGGWSDILSAPNAQQRANRMRGHVELTRGGKALGVTTPHATYWGNEGEESRTLFNFPVETSWPEPYASQWTKAATRRGEARVAIRYLTHIIQTGKVLE